MNPKICTKCGESKPTTEFRKRGKNLEARCKSCRNEEAAKYYVANKEKRKESVAKYYAANKEKVNEYRAEYRAANKEKCKASKIASEYGITLERAKALHANRSGPCPICGVVAKRHIDHCHTTGVVRCLICADCNIGLGRFKDNPAALLNAVAYLGMFR